MGCSHRILIVLRIAGESGYIGQMQVASDWGLGPVEIRPSLLFPKHEPQLGSGGRGLWRNGDLESPFFLAVKPVN
jgi:hypothetical protein